MLDNATLEALLSICDADPWDIPQVPLHHTAPRTCEGPCSRPVHVRVSTGRRFVCLDCATTLTQAIEQQRAVPA